MNIFAGLCIDDRDFDAEKLFKDLISLQPEIYKYDLMWYFDYQRKYFEMM